MIPDIDNWHFHVQALEDDAKYTLRDVILDDVSKTVELFLGIVESFDGDEDHILDDQGYGYLAADQLIEHTEAGVVLGIYCSVGDYVIRMFNCPGCTGSSLN